MKVKRVICLPQLPRHYAVERMDGSYAAFRITPYRRITEDDLSPLDGLSRNRAMMAPPLPVHEAKLYGLEIRAN